MYYILSYFIPTNIAHLLNIDLVLDQYMTMTELLIYNKIKRNEWLTNAKLFKLQMIIHQTNDKLSINSNSKEKKPVEICNSNDNKKTPKNKEQEPIETHTRDN